MKSHKSGSHSFRFKIALIKATNRAAIISLTQKKKNLPQFLRNDLEENKNCKIMGDRTKTAPHPHIFHLGKKGMIF